MKTSIKRFISIMITVVLLLSTAPLTFANAASFPDFPTGWSAEAMNAAINNGLLTGFSDGTIRPEDNLTRAEVATIIARAFGAQTTADISAFVDVPVNAWFYDYIARAVKMGALNGTSTTTMNPDLPITREQVFTAVARVLVLSSNHTAVLNQFNDAGAISSWAVPHMAALVERGYVNGDDLGNVNPQANITREEFAQFMHNAIRTYITLPGTYNASLEGITVIRVGGVKLKNLYNSSDLVVGDGAGAGEIVLDGISIEKRLLARGGTITVANATIGEGVVVNNVNGATQFMNYRTDLYFKNLTENTVANFLSYTPSFGSGGSGGITSDTTRKYTLLFYLKRGNPYPYATVANIAENTSLGDRLPTVPAAERIGYRFLGWFSGNTQVTGTTKITENTPLTLYARLERIDYPIEFKDEDGISAFPIEYLDNFTLDTSVNIDDVAAYVLPTAANIKRTGYTFHRWTDALGNEVTTLNIDVNTPETGFVLKPVFSKDTYRVEFYNEDGTLASLQGYPYAAPYTYQVDNILPLPNDQQVVVADNTQLFSCWKDENGTPVYTLTVTDEMEDGDTLKLYAHTVPKRAYTVSFYEGYAEQPAWMKNVTVLAESNKVAEDEIPDNRSRQVTGYKENETVASVYAGTAYEHVTHPTYWYEVYTYVCDTCGHSQKRSHEPDACTNSACTAATPSFTIVGSYACDSCGHVHKSIRAPETCANTACNAATDSFTLIGKYACDTCNYIHEGTQAPVACANPICTADPDSFTLVGFVAESELLPFNKDVEILGDLRVYLLYQRFGLFLNYDETNLALTVSAAYEDNTRLMDTVKDLAVSAGNQLNNAISNDKIPKYDELTGELKDRLINAGLVDQDMNIQVIYLPVRLFDVFNENTAPDVFEDHRFESYYQPYIDSMKSAESFVISSANLIMVKDVSEGIKNLTYDEILADTNNQTVKKIAQVLGNAFLEAYFTDMQTRYCDGLDEAIERVERGDSVTETYSTFATMRVNPIEILQKFYAQAQPELEYRLRNAGIRYNENVYLRYLVEHDVLGALFNGDASLASGDFTGYQFKSVMDYYNYLVSLLIVADDALCWYGDSANVTEAELDAIYDAIFNRIYDAHSKLNDILETYVNENKLPAQVQGLVDQVQQINSLLMRFDSQLKAVINKYLGSSINDKLEDGTIHENEKVQRVIDLLIGNEDPTKPTFNIDGLYAVFYQYDDNVQKQLKGQIDNGRLKDAIDRFEATEFGQLFKGNGRFGTIADRLDEIKNTGRVQGAFDSIYDVLVVLANEGIDVYRVEEGVATVKDSYQVTVAGVTLKIKRYYQ